MRIGPLLDCRLLPKIKLAVWQAELKYAPDGSRSFLTDGPRGAIYSPLPPDELLQHLDALKLDQHLRCAVLGAGLGLDSFYAATRFTSVTGFEIDPILHADAEEIRSIFGVENVEFVHGDFLDADLKPFGLVIFYMPFTHDLPRLMGVKLPELAEGSTVVSYQYDGETVFNPHDFTPVDVLLRNGFFAYRRV